MTTTTKGYNGYKNYNQWNCALWINNDQGLYVTATHYANQYKNKKQAASAMLEELKEYGSTCTPDGVKWSKVGIMAAMQEM
tara:strand:- start:11037 stop:11279 length:243 start_codon:yes stop_codon:yes gene_type:complete